MMIGRLKADNKLNWGMKFGPNYMIRNPLSKIFELWLFKITDKSFKPGDALDLKKQIKGFWYKKEFFSKWNILIKTKSIRLIYSIRFVKDK